MIKQIFVGFGFPLAVMIFFGSELAAQEISMDPPTTISIHRLALVIGSHDGGPGRERLRFAESDARAFTRTLKELGGLSESSTQTLIDPDSVKLTMAFHNLRAAAQALKSKRSRTEAIVYYSGHADETGLLLGSQSFSYRAFRFALDSLDADVRIAIVDACASGALTRLKGGKQVPAFMVDQSTRSHGYAILTSSSETEAAQESDRVGGSYFTQSLTSGLRGAADASLDGKVTLHEAYQYAYQETLARTESTQGGPQHAGYDMRLAGTGDVVLTDLRQANADLQLDEALQGRIFVRDSLGHLAIEVQKPAGRPMRLGLEPGNYELRLLQQGRWSQATLKLQASQPSLIRVQDFHNMPGEVTQLRGGNANDLESLEDSLDTSPVQMEFNIVTHAKQPWHGYQIGFLGNLADKQLHGGQATLGLNRVGGNFQGWQFTSNFINLAQGKMKGAQVAMAGVNMAQGKANGVQASGLANFAADSLQGIQASGLANLSLGPIHGAQAAGLFNFSGNGIHGVQAAGLFNGSLDSIQGAQAAGLFNFSRNAVDGAQGAGLFNIAAGKVEGAQGAGLFNISVHEVKGAQGSGLFNVAGSIHGAQAAGLVNVAGHVDGFQLSLLNLSYSYGKGFPIGLLSICATGRSQLVSWVDETGMSYVGYRNGVNHVYSTLAMGTKPLENRTLLAPTLGWGAQLDLISPLFFEGELLYTSLIGLRPETHEDWSRIRAGLGIQPFKHFEIFGGTSLNLNGHWDSNLPATGDGYLGFTEWNSNLSSWVGFYFGLRVGT